MKKHIFVLVIIFITLYSCNKDHEDNAVIPTPPNDSIYLVKAIEFDTTQPAPLDTVYVVNYSYDSRHRITTVTGNGYPAGTIYETTQYFYNGTDTLPYKSTITYSDPSETSTSTSFFQYVPGSRNRSFDSIIGFEHHIPTNTNYNDTFVDHYAFFGDLIQRMHDSYTSSGHQTFGPSYVSVTKQNGNIILQLDTTSADYAEKYVCTYDNHPNPYYNVAWYSNQSIVSLYKIFPDSYGLNNNVTEINNTITQISTSTIMETTHYKYSYKYRSDGYPIEIIMQDMGSTYPDQVNKMKYFYTN